jgi:SWI/SNF-related matrix-associated actin-dependent regulator 1 of chromatin subfamily A
MPTYPPDRIKAAWDQANGNAKMATAFLYDDNWKPKALASPTAITVSPTRPPPPADDTGRNKAIDDATQKARAAAREKGKKSAIYQNRSTIDLTNSSPVKAGTSTPQRAPTPPSPVFVMKRKRAKKIVDSDSDGAYAASDDDRRGSKSSEDNISETRALSYLNTAAPDAIQELTG